MRPCNACIDGFPRSIAADTHTPFLYVSDLKLIRSALADFIGLRRAKLLTYTARLAIFAYFKDGIPRLFFQWAATFF
ncbi:hypothetical protein CS390_08030 [Pseudomonas sp. HLS-6]|nr:hypothetical protein CS390_08030 [Pseudomonas sp. HLS-6]